MIKQRNDLFLQIATHIDQEIAATDEIEFGERRVLDQILLGKDQHVTDAFVNAVNAAVRIGRKKTRQPFPGDICLDAGRINANTGCGNGLAVDVCGKYLHHVALPDHILALGNQDGQGIGFLAGGASRNPDSDDSACRLSGKKPGDGLLLHHTKGIRITEKTGHSDQQIAKQRIYLRGGLLQMFDVSVHCFDLMNRHAPFDSAKDGAWFVLGKIVAGLGAKQDAYFPERIFDPGYRDGCGPVQFAKSMSHIGHKLDRHLGRWKLVVDHAGGNGASRHAVIFGGFGVLNHDHAALTLDGPHPQGAVTAGAGQHDDDGQLMLVLGQGSEKKINRHTVAPGRAGFEQLKGSIQKGHIPVGRNDVGTVGLDRHSVLDLENQHAGIALDKVGEDTFVVRGQMLHQNKGHARIDIGGHAGKKGFEGRQPSG